MRSLPFLALFAAVLFLATSRSASAQAMTSSNAPPVPDGAQVRLATTAGKTRFLLGEPIPLVFTLKNAGTVSFPYTFGGDYRGADRYLRYLVVARDEKGGPVADPNPDQPCFGGIVQMGTVLAPGAVRVDTVEANRYLRFVQPGTYAITVQHDFGWKATKERPFPNATITITIARPTPDEARAVVQSLTVTPSETRDGNRTDYTSLRDPIYLPLLAVRAESGDVSAVEGIGESIATPEATETLIRLTGSANRAVARQAAQQLRWQRTPARPSDRSFPRFASYYPAKDAADIVTRREYNIRHGWRSEFADSVRACGRRLLTSDEDEDVKAGATLLERVGTSEDLPPIRRALDRQATRRANRTRTYPSPDDAYSALTRAAKEIPYVYPLLLPTRTIGDKIAFLAQLPPRAWATPDVQRRCLPFLQDEDPDVRMAALTALPQTLPASLLPALRAAIPARLHDRDLPTRIEACNVAGRLNDPKLIPALVAILRTAPDEWLRGAAGGALLALHAHYAYLQTWTERIDEPALGYEAFSALASIHGSHGSGWDSSKVKPEELPRLKKEWQRFLAAHRAQIDAGHEWRLTDPDFPHALFPAAFNMD